MAGSVLVMPATVLPVTVQELKEWARITVDDEDALLEALLPTVVRQFELRTGRALLTQTWDLFLDAFPCWPEPWIELPRFPVASVTSVKYTLDTGGQTTIASTDYYVDTAVELPRVYPLAAKPWPTVSLRPANGVEVRFVGGYTSPELIPEEHRQTIKRMADYSYQNREGDLSPELEQALLAQSTRWWA